MIAGINGVFMIEKKENIDLMVGQVINGAKRALKKGVKN
jgi:hypothetical protein